MKLPHYLLGAGLAILGLASSQAQSRVAIQLNVNNQLRRVVVQLAEDKAPQSSENFKKLANSGFYQGIAVHRAIPGYIIQMGDPYTKDASQKHLWGTGGPDYKIPAETGLPMLRGAIAMARLPASVNPGGESNGSQFFIALDNLDSLTGYTVFGRVVNGIEHLDYIAEQTVDTNDVPIERVEIASVSNLGADGKPVGGTNVVRTSVAAAAGGVREAGEKVVGAVPTKLPKVSMPNLPKVSAPKLPKVSMPSLPKVSLPKISRPKISRPKLPSFGRNRGDKEEAGVAAPEEPIEMEIAETPAAPEPAPAPVANPIVQKPAAPTPPAPELPALPKAAMEKAANLVTPPELAEAATAAGQSPEKVAEAAEELADTAVSGETPTEDAKPKQKMKIPVPKKGEKSKDGKGLMTRVIERVW